MLTVHTSKPASTELFKVKLSHNNNLECKRLDLQYSLPSTAFREAFFPANTRTSLRLTSIPNTRLKNHKKSSAVVWKVLLAEPVGSIRTSGEPRVLGTVPRGPGRFPAGRCGPAHPGGAPRSQAGPGPHLVHIPVSAAADPLHQLVVVLWVPPQDVGGRPQRGLHLRSAQPGALPAAPGSR